MRSDFKRRPDTCSPSIRSTTSGGWTAVLLVALLVLSGCGPADRIEQRVLSFDQTGIPEPVRLPPMAKATGAAVRSRMVTAIATLPAATWFFKAVGPVDDLTTALPDLQKFLQGVRFDDNGQPQFTVPASWKSAPARPGRFKTFLFGAAEQPSIELAISELGPNQDLPSNVNRWRGQLALPPLEDEAARTSLDTLACEGGEFLLFDEVGLYQGGMAPAAGSDPSAPPGNNLPTATPTGKSGPAGEASAPAATIEPLEYTIPPGWNRLANAMFAKIRLERADGTRKAAISVSEMNPELNSWQSALGSWLAELELSGLDPDQVEPFVSEVSVDGQLGKQIRLLMPDAAKGIIATRVERAGKAWFVKLSGDKSLVEESVGDLNAFLQSIRFK